MSDVLAEVVAERKRQDAKWGQQNHSPEVWLMILGEEVGEAAKAALEAWAVVQMCTHQEYAAVLLQRRFSLNEYRRELIQVAAVALAMVESLDRNELAVAP